MKMIRPVSDLRNNFAEISKTVHETSQPVFLTKNGYGDMVVLSMEAYENLQFESEVYFKLREAEKEAELTNTRCKRKRAVSTGRQPFSLESLITPSPPPAAGAYALPGSYSRRPW